MTHSSQSSIGLLLFNCQQRNVPDGGYYGTFSDVRWTAMLEKRCFQLRVQLSETPDPFFSVPVLPY